MAKHFNIHVPRAGANFLTVHHKGWWANLSDLPIQEGDFITFDDANGHIWAEGIVLEIVPPGETSPVSSMAQFLNWPKIHWAEASEVML